MFEKIVKNEKIGSIGSSLLLGNPSVLAPVLYFYKLCCFYPSYMSAVVTDSPSHLQRKGRAGAEMLFCLLPAGPTVHFKPNWLPYHRYLLFLAMYHLIISHQEQKK